MKDWLESRGRMWADRPALVEAVASWMHANRGVLRTFLVRFWSTPEELDSELGARLESLYGGAERFLVGDRDEIRRPRAHKAARIAKRRSGFSKTSRRPLAKEPPISPSV